ncbi:MAG: ferrochelatase, partial [Candidatus Methylomirabilales bacterium]
MIAVLLMAYGTPRSLDEVEAYFAHIRRGRKPTE